MNLLKRLFPSLDVATPILYDEHGFYQALLSDFKKVRHEIIIESPFISVARMQMLYPAFKRMLDRGIKIHIITRDPSDLDEISRDFAVNEILCIADMGVNVILVKGNHHRKLAIIDRKIIYEGSLNILSQNHSKEIMRRIESEKEASQLLSFIQFNNLKNNR